VLPDMEPKELAFLETKVDQLIKLVEFFGNENKKLREELRIASNNALFDSTSVKQVVNRIKNVVKQLKEGIQ
jgi:hypothetical protein